MAISRLNVLTRPDGRYTLQAGIAHLVVDPSEKGEPGDIVVVWPRKKGPMVARRLARCTPYDTFHFRALDTGYTFEMPCNKVSAIHAVDAAGSVPLPGPAPERDTPLLTRVPTGPRGLP